jgi:lipid A 3-O-deacylase
MPTRILLPIIALLFALPLQAQTLTVAGGQTIRVATKHDSARVEGNFDWKPDLWSNDSLSLSLNQAVSVSGYWDKNDVYMISWAPNFILAPADKSGFYPYFQFGIGVALFSKDEFKSEDSDPYDDGVSDMGSNAQFENSVALGLVRDRFSIRAKVYHYSNAGLADPNGGMDVAEFGVSYRFK